MVSPLSSPLKSPARAQLRVTVTRRFQKVFRCYRQQPVMLINGSASAVWRVLRSVVGQQVSVQTLRCERSQITGRGGVDVNNGEKRQK